MFWLHQLQRKMRNTNAHESRKKRAAKPNQTEPNRAEQNRKKSCRAAEKKCETTRSTYIPTNILLCTSLLTGCSPFYAIAFVVVLLIVSKLAILCVFVLPCYCCCCIVHIFSLRYIAFTWSTYKKLCHSSLLCLLLHIYFFFFRFPLTRASTFQTLCFECAFSKIIACWWFFSSPFAFSGSFSFISNFNNLYIKTVFVSYN